MVHNPNDPLSLYGLVATLKGLCHPDQVSVFCHVAKKSLMKQFLHDKLPYRFDPFKKIGKNTIASFAERLHEKCGLKEFSSNRNHDWRTWAISRLCSLGDVNNREVMHFARHTNPTSQLPYVKKTTTSNTQFQEGIHSKKLPTKRQLQRKHAIDALRKKPHRAEKEKQAPPKIKLHTANHPSKKTMPEQTVVVTRRSSRIKIRKSIGNIKGPRPFPNND